MLLETLQTLNGERRARRPAAIVTDIATGNQRLVKAADVLKDPLAEPLLKRLKSGKSGVEGSGTLFIAVHLPSPRLFITGAVHVAQTLAPLAQTLEYDVHIVDPRSAFATAERFPNISVIAEWPDTALPSFNLDSFSAMVALAHDPKIDDPALLHALERNCFYVGALGSKKTHAKRVARLKEKGVSDSDTARICAPIGLDIGAASPAEIAVSIMAEITAQLRRP